MQASFREIDSNTLEVKVGPHGAVALIDATDRDLVGQYSWHHNSHGYAICQKQRNGVRTRLLMHRLIMQPPAHLVVDHINRNRLDNRRSNLRVCTQAANRLNSAPYGRGYYQHPVNRNWVVRLKQRHIASTATEEDAKAIVALVRGGGTYVKPPRQSCRNGHALNDTYVASDGYVRCRECNRLKTKRHYLRKRGRL